MADSGPLIEHFFRHQYGRIVAILVRRLGVRNLELVEDVVQSAMQRALIAWGQSGPPDEPAGWLLQTARRMALDALRRNRLHDRFIAGAVAESGSGEGEPAAETCFPDEIGDGTLRLLFLCCHPAVPAESGVALALKTVAGFGIREIAAAVLTGETGVQKRIERARQRMRELSLELEPLHHPWMKQRLGRVQAAIYLLFNEGFLSAVAATPIRGDLCDEALRMARLLANHPVGDHPETHALAALICFHSARSATRVDDAGALVLLDDQKRGEWDHGLIREGMEWMARSASGDSLSRYHLEAAIAWEHCRAASTGGTDWQQIERLYALLEPLVGGPAITLNRAIAESRTEGPRAAIRRMTDYPAEDLPEPWPLWNAVLGQLYRQAGEIQAARRHLEEALRDSRLPAERKLIERRLRECGEES